MLYNHPRFRLCYSEATGTGSREERVLKRSIPRKHCGFVLVILACGISSVAWFPVPERTANAQAIVSPVFATPPSPGANVDSTAVWVGPSPRDALLFVTEKDGDRLQVWLAATGEPHPTKPFLGGVADGKGPGEFNRPNGVWVIYHVPCSTGFADILLVTDQFNRRVQLFRLPDLEYFGEFGSGEIGKGYGIAWYQDGTDFFVFITDEEPPPGFPGKIKKYRLRPDGALLTADLVFGVGSGNGVPPLVNVESMFVDPIQNLLHVCGDEGGTQNFLFGLDGSYSGTYGEGLFEFDEEAINLYDLGGGAGYLIVSDQHLEDPNQFEVFDRVTLKHLGNFQSPAGTLLTTTNTDGAYLEQHPLPGFPNGAFYPVNDDQNVHVYDWTDIAEAKGLEIAALDRPFPSRVVEGTVASGPARPVLWFHDGSWWGALPVAGALGVARLEDGTFTCQSVIGSGTAAAAVAAGDVLAVLTRKTTPKLLLYTYKKSLRSYRRDGASIYFPKIVGPLLELSLETDATGRPARGWLGWVAGGTLRVTWSEGDLATWNAAGIALGSAGSLGPRIVRLEGGMAILWSGPEGVAFSMHQDLDPPESWSKPELLSPLPAKEIALVGAGGTTAIAAVVGSGNRGTLWTRGEGGRWAESPIPGRVRDPALVLDGSRGRIHLFHSSDISGRRIIHHRETSPGSAFPEVGLPAIAWPGVTFDAVSFPTELPPEAPDLVAAAPGSDGLGYFFRENLPPGPDDSPPITLQHFPPPGAKGVLPGATVSFRIQDSGAGVDGSRVRVLVNAVPVPVLLRGVPRNLLASAVLPEGTTSPVRIQIKAADLATPRNFMATFDYKFDFVGESVPGFLRGDVDGDGAVSLLDPLTLSTIITDGLLLDCAKAADGNDDGAANLVDVLYLLTNLFHQGPPPSEPWPACGTDPTPDTLDCTHSCE